VLKRPASIEMPTAVYLDFLLPGGNIGWREFAQRRRDLIKSARKADIAAKVL
jgi:hypothetical protein